jgi:hypothetical protein
VDNSLLRIKLFWQRTTLAQSLRFRSCEPAQS